MLFKRFIVALFALVFLVGCTTPGVGNNPGDGKDQANFPLPSNPAPSGPFKQLKLGTFKPPTPPPSQPPNQPPTQACELEGVKTDECQCAIIPGSFPPVPEVECALSGPESNCPIVQACENTCGWQSFCQIPYGGTTMSFDCAVIHGILSDGKVHCLGKPVIYLYPPAPTLVDVLLDVPGDVYISDPPYPAYGWLDVLAHPDGTLYYQGKRYHELYYETRVNEVTPPQTGIVIPKPYLQPTLSLVTEQLGLIPSERDEFLLYWLPKLTELPGNYVLFSILSQSEKERIDRILITPEPDMRIEFIAYFKALSEPVFMPPLDLPKEPPKRQGFTMVEWGGTIDY